MDPEPHCIGMYLTFEVARCAGGILDQSYCHDMTLAVWLKFWMSEGLSAAHDIPRFEFFLAVVGEGVGWADEVRVVLVDVGRPCPCPYTSETSKNA